MPSRTPSPADSALAGAGTDGPAVAPDAPVELPTDRPRDGSHRVPTGCVRLPLGALAPRLQPVAARTGTDLPVLLLAAVGVLLGKYTGRRAVTLDAELAGRRPGPVRLELRPELPFDRYLRQVGAVLDRPAEHRGRAALPVRFSDRTGTGTVTAELSLVLSGSGDELALRLDHDEALFDPDRMRRMAGHLEHLLAEVAEVAEQPERPLAALDLLSADERELLLDTFNATARPYPRDATVYQLFAEQAARTPDAVAVVHGDRSLTYRELAAAAGRLAASLRGAGVTTGQPVGLLLPRSVEQVVATVAILAAGGAYVPVDPDYPAERIEYVLADSGAATLVSRPELVAGVRFAGRLVSTDEPPPAGGPDTPADRPQADGPGPTDVVYVMYTSGTTGRPKGVEVTHRGVVRLVRGADYVPLSPATRILPTGAVVFDAATFELWGALLNGGSLHLVDSATILSAPDLGRALVEHRITTMWLTAPLFDRLVEQDPTVFRPLRHLLVGGDALSARHVGAVLARCPGLTLVNGYGPTENTTFSTTHTVRPSDLGRIPIGRPISNSTAYVVNADGQLCPVGVVGELYLGGDGVAAGYRNLPEATASAFVPNPFRPGTVLYRTGDLASWRPDGVLDFHGRRDTQVKVRGFRVEPGEIESVLLDCPQVRAAVVLARERPGGTDRFLCAYYVGPAEPAVLRGYLAERLPEHLVPAFLVRIPAIPLNRNGKVDRSALPPPDSGADETVPYVPPTADVQRTLVGLVEDTLGVRGVGLRHRLAALGADSLAVTLLAARIEQALGVRVPVRELLADDTVERIARRVGGADRWPAVVVPLAPDRDTYPLSPQQRRLYVEQIKDETATHYNVPVTVDLPRDTDVDRLVDALQRLTTRHDALRTEFCFVGGEVRQRILPAVNLPVLVLSGADGTPDSMVRPFDLGTAPLCRARVQPGGDHVRLQLDLHHAIVDGVSLGVLVEDLLGLYASPDGDMPPPGGLRYRDYAEWTASPEAAALRADQGGYWRQVFARPPSRVDLPLDAPRSPIRSLDGGVLEFDLGPERTARLRALARTEEVTLFAVLAAGYTALLAGLTGDPDVTVGTPTSGRDRPGLDRTVGMFANTVCLRVRADAELPFRWFVRQVRETAEEAFAHQDHPFEDLVDAVAPVRDYSRSPLFDALIAVHSRRYLQVDGPPPVAVRPGWNGRAVFDLNLQVFDTAVGLRASWQYAARLFRPETVEAFRDALLELLDTVSADPDTPLGALPARRAPAAGRTAPVSDIDFDFDL